MKLVTKQQMNTIDQYASTLFKIPSLLLMEHAANGIFIAMCQWVQKNQKILIVCGQGNNGGDGFALARLLWIEGYTVALSFVGNMQRASSDTVTNYHACIALEIPLVTIDDSFDIIVDCLFGTGLTRKVEGEYAIIINKINALNKKVISVDIPSGINADTGELLGCAIEADITYTLAYGKIGLYIYPGRFHSKEVKIIDIHLPKRLIDECESTTYLIQKEQMKKWFPKRATHSHKGSYGKVLCIGGSETMSGAICLAAKSALAIGCGMMTCAIPNSIKDVIQKNILESMIIALDEKDGFITRKANVQFKDKLALYDCILVGCGIGRNDSIKEIMKMLLESKMSLIIDADALYALKPYLVNEGMIITPHLKEFASLVDAKVEDVIAHTMQYVKAFCDQYPQVVLVLKSETTVIAKGQTIYINTYGNSGLAVGGSGDVLAGIITGLYAQVRDLLKAAVLGVFIHAYSGDNIVKRKSAYSLLPTDIIANMDTTIKHLKGD